MTARAPEPQQGEPPALSTTERMEKGQRRDLCTPRLYEENYHCRHWHERKPVTSTMSLKEIKYFEQKVQVTIHIEQNLVKNFSQTEIPFAFY